MASKRGPPQGPPTPEEQQSAMLYEQIKDLPLDRNNVLWLLFQIPSFVEENDTEYAKKTSIFLLRNFLLASTIGVTANVQLKRVFPPILKMSRFATLPIRLLTFAAPFGLFYSSTNERLYQFDKTLLKYQRRIANFQRTADIRQLEPPKN